MPAYARLVDEAIVWGRKRGASLTEVTDRVAVNFGAELTAIVPGRVSTEVDADLSFDTEAMIAKAKSFIAAYKERGIGHDRILIKLASTWEGMKAAHHLESEGNRLQHDAHVLARPGDRRGRGGRVPCLALRRPHPRLACEGGRRTLRRPNPTPA